MKGGRSLDTQEDGPTDSLGEVKPENNLYYI